ncbi:chromosomal replication initiator protein DnaA [Rickettsia parkeri str. Tate's Hell]|uniref:Chromosomal replication initiator protein DnaA n=4 Tax=Rickettsia parkeri TaxID=35792 RepID=A0ABR5DP96_RICPA|nr:chromosomal replication initiator protein DnaA [Rickettsia parkeri str. Tate's Hell]
MVILQLFQHYNNTIKSIEIITKELPGTTQTVTELPTKTFADIGSSELNSENIFSTLDVRFTFDNFVVGAPNELAYAAARAVAESSGAVSESNPLFLYGGVGLGKTHLMHAIGWYIKQHNPSRKVIYMSAEKFMYQFVKALRNKQVISFKEKFRSVDVLMIDDIQFICGKDSTQEEFFHTFNTLIDNNRQMVISCDRSPSDLDNIEDRIKSRLGWGLVADVHSTTYELRLGILESKIEQMNVKIPKDVIDFLASKIVSNVRELEGALNKVIAHSNFTLKEITLENTQNILRDLLRSNERIITVEDIQKKVASRYNIKLSDMSSSRRLREVARPRQIAMYLSKALTPKSLADIGKKFGKKDHTTVMHAIKKVEELLENDIELREEINLLMKILQN